MTVIEIFMAKRIISGANDYAVVIKARPDLKSGIDAYLISVDMGNLIV